LAHHQTKAQTQGRTIVCIDESGLSQRPHRVGTLATGGQTPVLQFAFNWKALPVVAGTTWGNFYFRMSPDSFRAPQEVQLLEHPRRHLRGPMVIVWDGLPAHRRALVQDFIASQKGRVVVEYLPAYAPELNAVEHIWGYWKQHELPNACPKDSWQLSEGARRTLLRAPHRPSLIAAFWKQSSLFL
jgi:transposase